MNLVVTEDISKIVEVPLMGQNLIVTQENKINLIANESISKVIVSETSEPKIIVVNKGEAGRGVPSGGLSGQVLSKLSNSDYDTTWVSGGSGDLVAANNLSDVANVDTARNNIGAINNSESIVNALIFG